MDRYLKDEQQQKLKDMLYGYLQDKANRRSGVTSKNAYEGAEENFVDQMALRDKGHMATALSSAASMAGTLGGKRSQDTIVPRFSEGIDKSTQQAYENFRTLRDSEERSNMNDLNVARYVSDLERADDQNDMALRDRDFRDQQYKDLEPKRKLEIELMKKKNAATPATKRNYSIKGLVGPDGRPAVIDEGGNPTQLPMGFKINEEQDAENYPLIPGYEGPDGSPVMRTPAGARPMKMGPGIRKSQSDKSKDLGIGEKQRLDNINEALAALDDAEKLLAKAPAGKWDRGMSWVDNATTMGDTSFDLASKRWKDAIGRMQSGGQIGLQEGSDFLGMYPRLLDHPDMIREKITKMRESMNSKRQTLGMPPVTRGGSGGKVRVRNIKTGQTGRVSPQYLDPSKYEVINE